MERLKNPLIVSIVIPVYNAASYIRSTIDSLLNQTYTNIEIICVDDGSVDTSVEILSYYSNKDSRVRVIKQENKFAGIARNKGLSHATGDYVMFLDADDVFERDMISYLVKNASRIDPDIIVFGYWRFTDKISKRRPVKNFYKKGTICSAKDINESLFQITRSLPWDKFIKKSFLDRTGLLYQGTRVNNDMYFNRMIVSEADRIYFCGRRFVNYRVNNKMSLQGQLNMYPAEFIKADVEIFNELNNRGTIDRYKKSFLKIVYSDIIYHIQKAKFLQEIEAIIYSLKDKNFLSNIGACDDEDLIKQSGYYNTFNMIMNGTMEECLFAILNDNKNAMVSRNCIEYRIGSRLLQLVGMKI